MSADRFKSVWESLIFILLDGNTEAAFSAELVTAVSTEIGMGFVPISICWHAMNSNLIPGVALRAVLFKGAGNFVDRLRLARHRTRKHLVHARDRNDVEAFLDAIADLHEVLGVLFGNEHRLDAPTQGREQLLLETCDRPHAAAQL